MLTSPESPAASLSHHGAQRPVGDPGDVCAVPPRPADGLELLGEMASSGHRRPPSLVRRADGQTIQVTPLLYRTLEAIDGRRDHEELARVVGERIGRAVAPEDIEYLVSSKLRPLGVLQEVDGSQPATRRANPLLALRLRTVMSDPALTDRLAAPFTPLFRAPVMLAVVAGFVALVTWLFLRRGVALAAREAFYEPGLLLAVFALTIGSAAFHELGHAAACRYGGGRPGAMGAGLYLVWPAFYTDVSDAYRLSRRARLRVDLGGIYFNAIFALGAFALWWATGLEALLLVVPLQVFQMVRQLLPLVRLDGYHILADLTGVPDLFAHIRPVLLGMLPTRWGRPESRVLRPWVRAVVTIWVLVVVPVLLGMLVMIVIVLPRLAATAWDSLGLQGEQLRAAWADQDVLLSSVRILSMAAVAIPVLSMTYLLTRVVRRTTQRAWRATEGRPPHRAGLVVAGVALALAVAAVWWPSGQYRPIVGDERGTVADLLGPIPTTPIDTQLAGTSRTIAAPAGGTATASSPGRQAGAASPSSSGGRAERPASTVASAPGVGLQPDTGHPDAMRQPATLAPSAPGADHPRSERTQPTERERVAFNVPEPREGDNFAVAENHTDGTAVVDFAVSLVFVDGEEPGSTRGERIQADNRNRAYALANCADCAAVAVAYQVVIIVGQVDVIMPENLAVALNVFCERCTSFAMAIQLVVTISAPLSDQAMAELEAVWAQLDEIRDGIATGTINAAQLKDQLLQIEGEILQVLADDGVLTWSSDGASSGPEDGVPPEQPDATTSTSTTSTPSTSTTTSTTTAALSPGSGSGEEESASEAEGTQGPDDTTSTTTTAPASSGTEMTDPGDEPTTTTTSPSNASEDEPATG